MVTTRTRAALRMFQRSRSPVAALAVASLLATPFGVSGVVAATVPSFTSTTASGARLISDPRFAVTPVLDSRPYLTVQDGVVVPPSSFSATGAVDFGAQNFRGAQDFRAAGGGSSFAVTPALDSKPYLTVQAGVVPGSVSAAGAVDTGAQNFRGVQDIRAASSATGMYPSDSRAASTGSGTYAALALLRAKRDGGATAKFGAVHKPYPL